MTWEHLLPTTRGTLPNGTPLRRTNPRGSFDARVVVLGAYPAATATHASDVGGTRMVLPTQVEAESFESSSKSGVEFDSHYLDALGLLPAQVLVTDILPYFLANTTKSKSGRSMSDNIGLFEKQTKRPTGIVTRPKPGDLVELARAMPGNVERLRDYVGRCRPRLILTLGAEPAAFVRGESFRAVEARVDDLFYARPTTMDVLGVRVDVVHLVHPHLFIKKNEKWMQRHRAWVRDVGGDLVRRAVAE